MCDMEMESPHCAHPFTPLHTPFPVYRPDMPQRLPVTDILSGLTRGTVNNLRHWLHLGFVAFVWLVIVPICICELYFMLPSLIPRPSSKFPDQVPPDQVPRPSSQTKFPRPIPRPSFQTKFPRPSSQTKFPDQVPQTNSQTKFPDQVPRPSFPDQVPRPSFQTKFPDQVPRPSSPDQVPQTKFPDQWSWNGLTTLSQRFCFDSAALLPWLFLAHKILGTHIL